MATDTSTCVDVDAYATGDGQTDDTLAIRQAIGTRKHLRFSRGKTYLYSGQLALNAGQIVYGNGATLKRRAQVQTTTSTPITAGQTKTIDVADASKLAVGMDIAISVDSKTVDAHNHTIYSISGNSVTVITPFDVSSSGTATVYSSHLGLWLFDDCRAYDLIMDGNSSSYGFASWQLTREIRAQGNRSLISGCYLKNSPGLGIYLERDFITVTDTAIVACGGNGIQLSSANRCAISRVRVSGANLSGAGDGCIAFGDGVDHTTISACFLENGLSGVGSLDQVDNSNVSIVGNTITGCTRSAIQGLTPTTRASGNVLISDNRIYDSKVLYVKATGSPVSVYPNHFAVVGNYLRNTRVEVRGRYVELADNIVEDSGTSATEIQVTDGKHVTVRGNTVAGGQVGISVDGASEGVLVEANSVSGQTQGAISFSGPGAVNSQIVNNHVTGTDVATAGYRGIALAAKELARGNMVNVARGESGIYADSGAIVKDNLVRSGAATYSIRTASGSSGVLLKDNEVTAPVSNGGDATNVETGTTIVS